MRQKVIISGPALSQTGYGEQCRFALRSLRSRDDLFDLYLLNTNWGGSNQVTGDTEEKKWIQNLMDKTHLYMKQKEGKPGYHFDMSLQVTIPNEFRNMAPINVGYTAGIEATIVAPQWLQVVNQVMSHLIVISNHAKDGFVNTKHLASDSNGNHFEMKMEKPCYPVNYPIKPSSSEDLDLNLKHDFNFLVTSQWGSRKNFERTIRWFIEENHDREVGLVIKTNRVKNCTLDRLHTQEALKQLTADFPDRKCSITLIHGYMTEQEIQGLYRNPKIKCLINLAHGEGFGLPLFDAAAAALPVMTVGWGGQKDFLYKDDKALFSEVDFDILPVQEECLWENVIIKGSEWSFAKEDSYKEKLADMIENYEQHVMNAKELKELVCDTFTEENQYSQFVQAFLGEAATEDNKEWWDVVEYE